MVKYLPEYKKSWALVIGIDDYANCNPLKHARNDATAIARVLCDLFRFASDDVEILVNRDATKSAIIRGLLRHSDTTVSHDNDRGLVFFAGHGHTTSSSRGEVGYLVPVDGSIGDLSSLIRWDELTRNADLLPAKHLMFIMDACYGGLAITRHSPQGSKRFLKDMLQRYSRQVLTAGKADEVVSDGNGPRPGHSIFTGHLLNALEGAAATSDGIVTANSAMAYVCDHVARDPYSRQTPHYGYIDGDGDFIFSQLASELLEDNPQGGKDVLISIPIGTGEPVVLQTSNDDVDFLTLLEEPRNRIKLDKFVTSNVRTTVEALGADKFPLSSKVESLTSDFRTRLAEYEAAITSLQSTVILLARWATSDQQQILATVFSRLADWNAEPASGLVVWIGLRWYPVSTLLYAAGIAALSGENFNSIRSTHYVRVPTPVQGRQASRELIAPVVERMLEVNRSDMWKSLPGHERHYAPQSEYIYKLLQPALEDHLYLGRSYESLFDRYEILRALMYADVDSRADHIWGPPGRFGWKYHSSGNPYGELCGEARKHRDNWPPLKAGLFQGSYQRFEQVAKRYENELLSRLNWT